VIDQAGAPRGSNGTPAAGATGRLVTTGNAGADTILGGGFPANSINILMGVPGTGKTLLAQQLAMHNASRERPVFYFTTLSEPLAKIVTYLQSMSFYDETKVGTAVLYQDLGAALIEHGTASLGSEIREAIRKGSPGIIIIDSFKAVHDLASSPAEMRRMVADLAGLLSAYDATTFLVGEYEESEIARYPEFAIADGVIEFARYKGTARDERYVRVSKLRGASYREGLHSFRISREGLEFYPRLISPQTPPTYTLSRERISSGISGLDAMLGGGLWRGTSTLFVGPSGCGKTTAAIQFCLAGIAQGERTLYLNFQENPTQLGRLIHALSDGSGQTATGLWDAMYISPIELPFESLIARAFARVQEAGIQRFVVDGVADLLYASENEQRVREYLYALGQQLAVSDVTSVFTYESGVRLSQADGISERLQFSTLAADCVILFNVEATDRLRRTVSVRKIRNSSHDLRILGYEITERGLQIGDAEA
jgi:circadian clock protein KaiC